MDRLPREILLMIFRLIDDSRERARLELELVCRRWRQIMLSHGWRNVQRIPELSNTRLIEPIGDRCGAHLTECSFYSVTIDFNLIRHIAEHFPVLKHLEFRFCEIEEFDGFALECARLGARLRSLTFFETKYHYPSNDQSLLFTQLRHLGLDFCDQRTDSFSYFSTKLRSLYLSGFTKFSSKLELMLRRFQNALPKLAALYLDNPIGYDIEHPQQTQQLLSRISNLKNLRFLRMAWYCSFEGPELLCTCLNALQQLIGLQLNLSIQFQQVSDVFRCPAFHCLVHLSLSHFHHFGDFEPIGLLSTSAPQLRSLCLDVPAYLLNDLTVGVGSQVLKIAQNGTLEYLNVSCAKFTVGMLDQLIRFCPNLHSICAQLWNNETLSQVADLRSVVADQWRAGTRKHLPLRVWIYNRPHLSFRDRSQGVRTAVFWQDPFVSIHTANFGFVPPNPVLNELFRDEVFNDDNDGGGTPSFVTDHYSSRA